MRAFRSTRASSGAKLDYIMGENRPAALATEADLWLPGTPVAGRTGVGGAAGQ